MLMNLNEIANKAGFAPGPDGKFNFPATQEAADALGGAAVALLPVWQPGDAPVDVVLTGAGPAWAHLMVAHALHGQVRTLTYSAPNTPGIVIYSHGG